ncbi:MAG: hypothetical protein ACXW3Z_00485 [Limisphaerales bacterium]
MMIKKSFTLYQFAVGTCDTLTGVLLLIVPQFALKLMGVTQAPAEPVFISFIGAFVLSVGLTYLVFAGSPRSESELGAARAAWLITGLGRLCAGTFVLLAITAGRMELPWISITVVDLSIGGFQLIGLRRQWLEAML